MLHKIKKGLKAGLSYLKRNRGEILYYAAVLLVLSGLAWGAEQYRSRRAELPEPVQVVSAAEIAEAEPVETSFELPAGLILLRDFSPVPLWNEQDLSWQAHPAADYASADGLVRALADGTVQAVGVSGVLGGFAQVQSGEVVLKYCCIRPDDRLVPGAEVRKGDIIGAEQNTMPAEAQLGNHLHLEAYRGGEIINPRDLLQGND